MTSINYQFSDTAETKEFWNSHPNFYPAFEKLITLTNKCFARDFIPKSRAEDICFGLGEACRADFSEVVFLAVHGHGNGATKLLRSLYERAVTAAYITNNPDKAERFLRFAAIQEHRVMVAALGIVSEAEFDEMAITRGTSVAETRRLYQEIKSEFQVTVCEKCETKRLAGTWDIDVAAMVHSVGGLFQNLYLSGYAIPTLEIHATLASAAKERQPRKEADVTLMCAWILLGLVIKYQNVMFALGLDAEIASCEEDVPVVWASAVAPQNTVAR